MTKILLEMDLDNALSRLEPRLRDGLISGPSPENRPPRSGAATSVAASVFIIETQTRVEMTK